MIESVPSLGHLRLSSSGKSTNNKMSLKPRGPSKFGRASSAKYKPGDIVIVVATKFKNKYHEQECKVLQVLTKQYKVKMLTGAAKGQFHKYLFHCVRSKEEHPEEQPPVAEGVDASVEEEGKNNHESGNVDEILDLFK